jgi:hypothetical protein
MPDSLEFYTGNNSSPVRTRGFWTDLSWLRPRQQPMQEQWVQ